MSIEVWLTYAAACAVVLAIPGPTVLLVIAYALSHGRRVLWPVTAGVVLGDFVAMTVSLLGVGALLATSATLFTLLKWAGALYLVYLGVMRCRAGAGGAAQAPAGQDARRAALHAFAVTALNPKSIAFFVAFLPHFIDRAAPLPAQMLVLEATFLTLAGLGALGYALAAGRVRAFVGRDENQRLLDRVGGGTLIGAGLFMASVQRT